MKTGESRKFASNKETRQKSQNVDSYSSTLIASEEVTV